MAFYMELALKYELSDSRLVVKEMLNQAVRNEWMLSVYKGIAKNRYFFKMFSSGDAEIID